MTTTEKSGTAEVFVPRQSRPSAAAVRDQAAAKRDEVAVDRDLAAAERDRRAELRDEEGHRISWDANSPGAAQDREDGGRDRHDGVRDREDASRDREDASRDREDASRDRKEAAEELQALTYDELTRTRRRGPGLHDLQLEVERAHRTDQRLAVAYVDVDGLKALNDSEGHAAGDQLLRSITEAVRASMRRYDSVVRLGGDEFLCILPGADAGGARSALDHVCDSIAGSVGHGSISFGIAELGPLDSWQTLVAAADADLIATRRHSAATTATQSGTVHTNF
jgi:diguanylate cyclase (GGDEF)-like protein